MITLTLLHPSQPNPVQNWTFERKQSISIGRSHDNDVVIYSAVVSRHHVELWESSHGWQLVSFGANGTYLDELPITQVSVVDGMIVRLGSSGPRLQINFETVPQDSPPTPDQKLAESQGTEETTITPKGILSERLSGNGPDTDMTIADFG